MKNYSLRFLEKKLQRDMPNLSSITDNLYSFFRDTPPFALFECIIPQKCNDFSCSDSHLFVFNTIKDEIEIISDLEEREKLTEGLSQSSSRSKLPSTPYLRLNSRESFFSKGVFIEKGGLVFFRTPDGGLKQWSQRDFIDHDTSSLEEASCFAVDSLSQKVYYFTHDSTLCSLNLNSGQIVKITMLRQRGIYRMELVQAVEDYIVFQSRSDDLFIINLESLAITKFFPTHLAQTLLPSVLPNSLLVIKGDSLYVLQLQPQYVENKVSFTSQFLDHAQPLCISGNTSGPYLAVAFESAQIALVNQFTLKEECILCERGDLTGSVQKMLFSEPTGQFLYVLDSSSSLYKFKIFQNLKRTSVQMIQKSQLDLNDSSFQNTQDSKLQAIKEEEIDRATTLLQVQKSMNFPYFRKVFPDKNIVFEIDFRGKVKLISHNTDKYITEISDHLLQFKILKIISVLYWSELEIYLIIYRETILFVQPYTLSILGFIRFKNPGDLLKNARTQDCFLILQFVNNETFLVEFVNEQLPMKASRCFPCVFNLFYPTNSQLIMQCSGTKDSIPFFPKVHLNHAFEQVYNPYSPILFWYKVINYQGIRCKTLAYFKGHEHILFHQRRLSLLHFYAYESHQELLKYALEEGAPLLNDSWKQNPLSIAMKRKSISCIEALLDHFSVPRVNPLYSDSLILQHNLQLIANCPNSTVPEIFANLEIDPSKEYDLPNFVNFQNKTEVFIPLKERNPNELLPLYIDLKEEQNLCSYSLTTVEFDIIFGSKYNLKFLKALINSPHLQIFNAPPIQSYIRYHWKTARKFFIVETINFIIYVIMLSLHAMRIRKQNWLVYAILGLSILQACQQLWQCVGQGVEYFSNLWNIFDFLGILMLWVYIALYFIQVDQDIQLWFLALSCFQIFWKLFTYVRSTSSSRFLFRVIRNIFQDIKAFLSFMILYTIAFTVVFLAASHSEVLMDGQNHFFFRMYQTYRFDLGKADPLYLSQSTLMKVIYVPSTILVIIILFNLLIALIRDSFIKTKQNRDANDYLEISHMMLDYMSMALWNYSKSSLFHLFHCHNTEKRIGINGLTITQSHRGKNAKYLKSSKKVDHTSPEFETAKILKRLDQISARINKIEDKLNSEEKREKNQILPREYQRQSSIKKPEFGSEKLLRKTIGLKRSMRHSNSLVGSEK